MFEALVTFVKAEAQGNTFYPVTYTYKLQFETEADFLKWLNDSPAHDKVKLGVVANG